MPQELFRVASIESAQVIELSLPEMLDSLEFDELSESILRLLRDAPVTARKGGQWVLDLSHVSYMGSAMLGLMVNLRQQIKSAGGTLVLCAMPPSLLRIFRACCMEKLFIIAKTRADALKMN